MGPPPAGSSHIGPQSGAQWEHHEETWRNHAKEWGDHDREWEQHQGDPAWQRQHAKKWHDWYRWHHDNGDSGFSEFLAGTLLGLILGQL